MSYVSFNIILYILDVNNDVIVKPLMKQITSTFIKIDTKPRINFWIGYY